MPDSHDYPLAEVIGSGDLIHQARPAALFGSRIRVETRCGMEGNRTGRDGGAWCPECVALERAETDTHDERGGNEAVVRITAMLRAYRECGDDDAVEIIHGGLYLTIGDLRGLVRDREYLAAATARTEKAQALVVERRQDVAAARRERDEAKAEVANLNGCLMLFLARYGNQTFHDGDLKRAAKWLTALAADAAPDGLSEPVERSETSGGHGEGSNSSAGTAGLSERCRATKPDEGVRHHCDDDSGGPHTHECGDCAHRWNDDTTEDGRHG